jgi:hypothetical protein
MRPSRVASAIAAVAAVGLAAIPFQHGASAAAANTVTLAVYGDNPYGLNNADVSQVNLLPQFIANVNADPDVNVVAHVGDIHSGKSFCTAAYDNTIASAWATFARPLVYTPGDNEWADCHKKGEGGGAFNSATGAIDFVANGSDFQGNPAQHLALVRSTFFPKAGATLGSGTLKVTSQATAYDRAHPEDKAFVENVRWMQKDILFVTVNIPGGSNNDADPWYGTPDKTQAQLDDIALRTAADNRWIDAAFAKAKAEGAAGVVIMEQADMWDLDGKKADHIANYETFIQHIADGTKSFAKPVLLLNGDSHAYRSDNPLLSTAPCVTESPTGEVPCTTNLGLHPAFDNVANFHRVVVHGSTSPLEWLKLTINEDKNAPASANAFGPFSWVRQNTGLVGNS